MPILRWLQPLICAGTISYCSLINLTPAVAAPNIIATAISNANNLPIIDTGSNTEIIQIADLQISTDASNGLKLVINVNSLSKTDGAPIPIQFLVIPDGGAPPSAAAFTIPATTNYEYTIASAGNENLDLYIKYTPGQLQDPGNYRSTVELSVADNP